MKKKKLFTYISKLLIVVLLFSCLFTFRLAADNEENASETPQNETDQNNPQTEGLENSDSEAAPALAAAPADPDADQDLLSEPEEAEDSEAVSGTTVGDFYIVGPQENYTYADGVLRVKGDITVSNKKGVTTTSDHIVVADNCTLTLDGVNIAVPENASAIQIIKGVEAVLVLNNENSVTGGVAKDSKGHAGVEVGWAAEKKNEETVITMASLTIKGEGKLTATGGGNAAGIGGSSADTVNSYGLYGNITIESGTIIANGNGSSAGIGSSGNPNAGSSHGSYKHSDEQWGTITINGGTIEANGVGNGAGIGGGSHVDSGKIVINGGDITANGDSGIGSGLGSSKGDDKGPGYYCADVTINGGNITAYATNNMGAGIGGGMYCDAYVTITGGTVNASVSTDGKLYQGGAGIGGGYQGLAVINISGGDITATGGNGSAGIGNGALGSETTTNGPTETKNVRTGAPTIAANECEVNISGGTVRAQGGIHGAGIGSGNASQWCNVNISGGDIMAIGGASNKDDKQGGAGIGSGTPSCSSKSEYYRETDVSISITGGNVTAIGGWGAAGIGSGANNKRAEKITIDAENADVTAYADGTKFAIDTRELDDAGNTSSNQAGRDVNGYILQGTLVHDYTMKDEDGKPIMDQHTEGLNDIQIIRDDDPSVKKELNDMPEGYRSFATDLGQAGVYTIYTDSEQISEGGGRYFAEYEKDVIPDSYWSDREKQNRFIQYTVKGGGISDNFYLYPVKSIVVSKQVETEKDTAKVNVNLTAYFAIREKKHDEAGNKDESDDLYLKKDGKIWIEAIRIVNGEPQQKAYFANIEDKEYEIIEVDSEGRKISPGKTYGSLVLSKIETRHGEGSDNDGVISKDQWTDRVTVINTYKEEKPRNYHIPKTGIE